MGDQYLRDEFARHRTAAPEYIPGFIKGWTAYRDTLAQQLDEASERVKGEAIPVGAKLEPGELDSLSPQQLGQLYALKQAAKSNKDGDA
nr:acetate non-utilizing protein 9 [Polyrhizophydium stewartii]